MTASNKKKVKGIVLAICATVMVLALYIADSGNGLEKRESPGDAPPFQLKNLEGEGVSLADYAGKFVLLNLWATWCGPCVEEMPSLQRLYDKFGGKDFVIVAVSFDQEKEEVRSFVEKLDLTFPILMDEEQTLMLKYEVSGIPTTILIDKDQKIIATSKGGRAWDNEDSLEYFSKLLGVKPASQSVST